MRSTPFRSPWGLHKTRMALRSRRINRMLDKHPQRSPMGMRFFDNGLWRFSDNWK